MSQSSANQRLVVYSDYVCPFCYLGKAAMEQYLAEREADLTVEWRQFDLRGGKRRPDGSIDHAVDDGKDDDYFAEVRENVQKLKERYDVEMTLDFSLDVDSWSAQQVGLYVQEELGQDAFDRLNDAVFDALWQDERDIGDPDVLVRVAESVDIDGEAVREAVESDTWDDRLRERFDTARRMGITGIPTFVYGDHAARGAVPPAHLRRLVEGR